MLNDLDPIIDDVAKAMTSVPANTNVAARVGTRIRDVGAPRRAVWARPIWIVPAAAACVLTVALFLPRKTATPVTTRPTPVVDVAKASEPGPAASRTPQTTLPAIGVEAMDVEPIAVPAIVEAEHIDIDPIAIARIEIAPMP